MKILMVLTSHDQMGDTGHKTGFWLEEFTSPFYVFKDAGADIALTGYVRFNLGEGIEKEETDFAAEVAAQLS